YRCRFAGPRHLTIPQQRVTMCVGTRVGRPPFGLAAIVVALSAALPAAAAAQQPVTLAGVFHTVWVDPRGAPAPDPLYFVSGAHGVVRLELSAGELARAGGRRALERRRVTVSGLLETPAPAPGQPLARALPSVLRV